MTKYFPVLSSVLFQMAGVGHIVQMFVEQSAAGQSVVSWLCIVTALVLWERFYVIRTPAETVAIWTARVGIMFNTFIAGVVIYLKYLQ